MHQQLFLLSLSMSREYSEPLLVGTDGIGKDATIDMMEEERTSFVVLIVAVATVAVIRICPDGGRV
jgi:ABC-type dipeptide/oligopeptide/nickel transport system permease subunit